MSLSTGSLSIGDDAKDDDEDEKDEEFVVWHNPSAAILSLSGTLSVTMSATMRVTDNGSEPVLLPNGDCKSISPPR